MKKKLIIYCMAVGLSLVFSAISFAAPTTYLVDGDTNALPWAVADGTISFAGTLGPVADLDVLAAGGSGNSLQNHGTWATLSWDFDVDSVEFIYGGNAGGITVEILDSSNSVINSFYQADTYVGAPAGPITIADTGIRSIRWTDPDTYGFLVELDNILLTLPESTEPVIPAPGAALLSSIGAGLVGWLRRRKTL
jgi:hypothetical protein